MKRVIVCCDGTWNEPDQKAGGAPCPTNVVKFAALIPAQDGEIEQRVLYHPGIGSDATFVRKWIEGATGLGITRTLAECYRWLVRNYAPGDELYFFGFSRGAYTARSLGGFVRNSGILRPENEDLVPQALALYRSRDWRTQPRAAASRLFRQSYAWSLITPIQCIGVWDTVGSLGIPNTLIQGVLKHLFRVNREFHDTDLSATVKFAFHAVAIDERRKAFLPTLWTQTEDGVRANQRIEQEWFPGNHSDVGGGTSSPDLSDIALDWMGERARIAGLSVSHPDNLGPPDFPAFHPSEFGPIVDTLPWYSRLLFGVGIRDIDTDDVARHESVSDAARNRWTEMPAWRPEALADYVRRKGGVL